MKTKSSPKLRTLSKAVLLALPLLVSTTSITHAETNTDIASGALVGATVQYSPNVLLALSVEFPTAGLAYNSTDVSIGNPKNYYNTISIKNRYLGYFDNRKCYVYVPDSSDSDAARAFDNSGYSTNGQDVIDTRINQQTKQVEYFFNNGKIPLALRDINGANANRPYKPVNPNTVEYFKVSSNAVDTNEGVGLCSGSNPNEFSGNMLNWASMAAIDIFRQALTGGNRAATMLNTSKAYELGDTPNETYLRRALVVAGRQNSSFFTNRYIYLPDNLLKRVMPSQYASDNLNDFVSYSTYSPYRYSVLRSAPGDWAKNKFGDGNAVIVVDNQDFSVSFRRRFYFEQYFSKLGAYFQKQILALPIKARYMPYHAVVRVCDDAATAESYGTKDATTSIQCTKYPNGKYKPTGLMQERINTMRFGAFGYANVDDRYINGGVLRARMKSLLGETAVMTTKGDETQPIQATGTTVTLGAEIHANTGQFVINPDTEDAAQSKVSNSGVINYLNKFGDYAGYKTNDPGAELYYVAQRYLRNTGFPEEYNSFKARNPAYAGTNKDIIYQYTLRQMQGGESNTAMIWKDNFPIILDWDNPLVVNSVNNVRENACRPNQIVFIGDTNTHYDIDLPGYGNSPTDPLRYEPKTSTHVEDKEINVSTLADTILNLEGIDESIFNKGGGGTDVGAWSGNSRFGLPALAYWGRLNDIQTGLVGKQTINTFAIDVVENNDYKANYQGMMKNTYYLAAKYGGFNDDPEASPNRDIVPYVPLPDVRSEWTDDLEGRTSISAFKKGVPRTYAIANTPESMVRALKNAIGSAGGADSPTQANVTTDEDPNVAVDVERNGLNILQSTYTENSPVYSGGLIKTKMTVSRNKNNGFTYTYTTLWNAGALLEQRYHNRTTWSTRNVVTSVNNQAVQFNMQNESTLRSKLLARVLTRSGDAFDTKQLIPYVLGDDSNEGATSLRTRNGYLMGMVINSSPAAIRPVHTLPTSPLGGTCTYDDDNKVRNRAINYAVAANDGMLHIFDNTGAEKMAYIPEGTLSRLNDYASSLYRGSTANRWLNDGSPTIAEVCDSSKVAHSVLIGTTGRGGNSVYALDVTNLSDGAGTNNVLWDFSVPELGLTIPQVVVTHDKDGNPIAIVSSGYRNNTSTGSDDGYIFVLKNIHTKHSSWTENVDYYKIKLGKAGVGEIFAYDDNNDNSADALYVGDLEGKLWKLDQDADGQFKLAYGADTPLFKADASIVGAPYAQKASGNVFVTFATGRFFGNSDLPSAAEKRSFQNYAYGVFENKITTANNGTGIPMIANDDKLLQQEFVKTFTDKGGAFSTITQNPITQNHTGWRLKFPANMLSVSNAWVNSGRVAQFQTVTPDNGSTLTAENVCTQTGDSAVVMVNLRTGGNWNKPLFDTNDDGSIDEKDQAASVIHTYNNMILKSSPTKVINGGIILNGAGNNGRMSQLVAPLGDESSVKRLSWREIF